jgi:hypothetical protein
MRSTGDMGLNWKKSKYFMGEVKNGKEKREILSVEWVTLLISCVLKRMT